MKRIIWALAIMTAVGLSGQAAFAGFQIGEEGERDLEITGYFKTGFMWLENDEYEGANIDANDETGFYVKNARVILAGHILPCLTYMYQVDFAPGNLRSFTPIYGGSLFKSEWGSWAIKEAKKDVHPPNEDAIRNAEIAAHNYPFWVEARNDFSPVDLDAFIDYDPLDGKFRVRAGRFKVPFGRQWLAGAKKLQFAKESFATQAVLPGGDIGLMFHGVVEEGIFEYAVGFFNGNEDLNGLNWDKNLLIVARLAGGVGGEYTGKYDMVDMARSENFFIHLGVSAYANSYKLIKDGVRPPDLPADATNEASDDEVGWGADINVKWRGLSFTSEAVWHSWDWDLSYHRDGYTSFGGYAQVGYLFEKTPIEPAIRLEVLEPDDCTDFIQYGYTFGVNYYLKNHEAKIVVNYTFYDEDFGEYDIAEIDNDEFIILTQIIF